MSSDRCPALTEDRDPDTSSWARWAYGMLHQLHDEGKINDETFNFWIGQLVNTRLSLNDRLDRIAGCDAIVRFATFLPSGLFTSGAAAEPVSEARVREVTEEFHRTIGLKDRHQKAAPAKSTRLSHGTPAYDDGGGDNLDPVTREFWRNIGLLPRSA